MRVPLETATYLLDREPLFHHKNVIWDEDSFDAEIAADFEEITASGRSCGRETIKEIVLGRLRGTHPETLAGGYRLEHVRLRPLTAELIQVRYVVREPDRSTSRSTLYRAAAHGWQAVFHQGTVIRDIRASTPQPGTAVSA